MINKCIICNNKIKYNVYNVYCKCLVCNIDYFYNHYYYLIGPKGKKSLYFKIYQIPLMPKTELIDNDLIIATWNYILDVNPNNINEKLKFYMTFS